MTASNPVAATLAGVLALATFFAGIASLAGCKDRTPLEQPPPVASSAPTKEKATTAVTMSAAAIQAADVVTAPVASSTITVHDEIPGTIEAPREALVIVNTRVAGVVDALEVDIGDRVTAGQRLATVRSVELAKAQADYRRSVAVEEHAARALKRSEELASEGLISKRRLEDDQLASRESRLEVEETSQRVRILGGSLKSSSGVITITAPIAGGITARSVNRGEALAENAPLFTVVDVSRVIVQLRAPAGLQVAPGTEVSFTIESLPEKTFTAVVKSASDVVDPETRRFPIRCSVVNSDGVLKPGMFVAAKVPRPAVRGLAVPETAILVMEGGASVFVAHDGGRFERRPVVLGPRAGGQVAIQSGLAERENVVVQGAFWVRTELQKSELEE